MERGLLWLPLLAVFCWFAWLGWNEYQKISAYQSWAKDFDRAKYDIYAVLGQKGRQLTWGKPTRSTPENLTTFSLDDVQSIRLLVDNQPFALESPPNQGKVFLEFLLADSSTKAIPFTEISLAAKWGKYLREQIGTNK
jgi:hypothetical protein